MFDCKFLKQCCENVAQVQCSCFATWNFNRTSMFRKQLQRMWNVQLLSRKLRALFQQSQFCKWKGHVFWGYAQDFVPNMLHRCGCRTRSPQPYPYPCPCPCPVSPKTSSARVPHYSNLLALLLLRAVSARSNVESLLKDGPSLVKCLVPTLWHWSASLSCSRPPSTADAVIHAAFL